MSQTATPPLDALDQWGIQFPLLAQDLAELEQARSSSLAGSTSSWRFSIPTVSPARAVMLDQWGIEFPIPDEQLAAFAQNRPSGRGQARTSVLVGSLHGISQFAALAAILAVVVAGIGPAFPASASPGAAPTDGAPVLLVLADSAQIGNLPSITEQPSAVSTPTPGPTLGPTPGPTLGPTPDPTPDPTLSAEAFALNPFLNAPAAVEPQTRPFAVELSPLPTIGDARVYLVARLGARVDRHWGIAQSSCASLIFEYEANWNPHATNKTSGAYGLPQAKPASKLANWAEAKGKAAEKAGDPDGAWLYRAWRDNPVVQAEWGVDYMTRRYGSPCAALAFRSGYWQGGVLIPGVGWY